MRGRCAPEARWRWRWSPCWRAAPPSSRHAAARRRQRAGRVQRADRHGSSRPRRPGARGPAQLTSGAVRLTVRSEDASQRPVLESYLGFFAAYADALGKADARSAQLRRRSTPEAFADFSRGIAANARDGVTLRGPVSLQPALRKSGSAALTIIVDDCLDGIAQRYYDRAGEPTGQAGDRRPIQVELIDSPGPVRWVVGSLADGPATACERSGS